MAKKGFTVKASTPKVQAPVWDIDAIKERMKGKTVVFCLPGRGCSYIFLKNFVQLCFDMESTSFFTHFPIALLVWLGVILIRPVSVFMFFRDNLIEPEEFKILSSWSPKGAISMALIVTAPELLEETFGLEGVELIQESSEIFMVNVVCGVVIFSMVVKSLIIPIIHDRVIFSAKSRSLL